MGYAHCVCVVCSSGGYPGEYEKGKEILGLEEVEKMQDVVVFHAGTQRLNDSTTQRPKTVTNGGRVLGVTGLGNTIKEAIEHTYQAVERIHFEGMHYRRDIGQKALKAVCSSCRVGIREEIWLTIISIIMGSHSDLETMKETINLLKEFKVGFEVKVLSAHRSPTRISKVCEEAPKEE